MVIGGKNLTDKSLQENNILILIETINDSLILKEV